MKNTPSTEERFWAVLAHLSAVAFGMGILLPVIGWSSQRTKSAYATFHSLQALGYQSLGYTIWVLGALVIIVIQMLGTFSTLMTAVDQGANVEQLMSISMSGHFVVMTGLIAVYLAFPVIGAFACALGRDFRYPMLGHRLAGYVGYSAAGELNEDRSDRFVAAMGHFAVIIGLWGMLAPLTTWIMEGKRNLFVRFQALQTLIYQAAVTVLFFSGIFGYLVVAVMFLGTLGLMGEAALGESAMLVLALMGCLMLVVVFVILLVPVLHILGQVAGYRILKGQDYRYPIVGKQVDKRMAKADF